MKSFLRRYKLLILASPLLFLPLWEYARLAESIRGYVRDTGVIVDHVEVRQLSTSRWKDVIEYSGLNGERRRFTSDIERRPASAIGTTVEILVEPNGRQHAYRAGIRGYWFGFSIIATLSYGFYAALVAITYFSRHVPRSRKPASYRSTPIRKGAVTVELEDGTVSSELSVAELDELLRTVGRPGNRFAVIAKDKQTYMQTSGDQSKGFIVEYRDGRAKNYFVNRGRSLSQQEMTELLLAYYSGQNGWKHGLEWERKAE